MCKMSSEVCPFCGKTYKRLKSHLPHCKAAASSKTFPNKDDVRGNLTSLLVAALPKTTTKEKSKQTSSVTTDFHAEKGRKVALSSSLSPIQPDAPSASSSITKKKLIYQIKDAASPALPLSPTVSKPKKKSVRALLEAAKLDQVTKGLQESDACLTPPFSATKPKDVSKKKVSKTKKALSSNPLDSKVNESSTLNKNSTFWEDREGEVEDLSVYKPLLKSGSGHHVKVILQDVKATLGRANASRKSNKQSILSHSEAADNLGRHDSDLRDLITIKPPVENEKDAASCSVTPTVLSDNLLSTTQQETEVNSVCKKSKQTYLISLQDDAAPKLELTSPAAYLSSASVSSQAWQAAPSPGTIFQKGSKVAGLLPVSPPVNQFVSPLQYPPAQSLPGRAEEMQLGVRKQTAAEKLTAGALTQQSVGQVRLRELPERVACRTPSHPRDVGMMQRGWQWYYRKYIDVKKGGAGGLGMLLVGYCVISYIWGYPHLKLSRWRKFH